MNRREILTRAIKHQSGTTILAIRRHSGITALAIKLRGIPILAIRRPRNGITARAIRHPNGTITLAIRRRSGTTVPAIRLRNGTIVLLVIRHRSGIPVRITRLPGTMAAEAVVDRTTPRATAVAAGVTVVVAVDALVVVTAGIGNPSRRLKTISSLRLEELLPVPRAFFLPI